MTDLGTTPAGLAAAEKPVIAPDAVFCLDRTRDGERRPTLYFFKGSRYFCWDVIDEKVLPGFPRDIDADWPGLRARFPGAALRGALYVPAWGERVYFLFQGEPRMVVWDLESGTPGTTMLEVQSLLPSALTAGDFTPVHALLADGQPVIYAFHKFDYTRWTVGNAAPASEDPGFPRRTEHDWKDGLVLAPRAGVYVDWPSRSAAHSNRKIYFFMGNLYLRWDVPSNTRNYRLDVIAGWKGWPLP